MLSQDVAAESFKSYRFPRSRAGFTLVELLVVVAIIGILTAMLLPAISRSKSRALAIFCMNNSRQLAVAWTLYTQDNNNRLVYNLGGDPLTTGVAPSTQPNWVNNVMDWTLSPDNTNTSFAVSDFSLLGHSAGSATGIYKCPADRALSDVQKQAGWSGRVRSVSMNAMMGNPGAGILKGGSNVNNPTYRQFLNESDISEPSRLFVFLDEHPDSINDGYFQAHPAGAANEQLTWVDLPASYHAGGGSFTFADAHTEIHRWQFDATRRPAIPGGAALPFPIRTGEEADFFWLLSHMSLQP